MAIIIIKICAVLALGVIDSGHLFSFNMDLYNISGVLTMLFYIYVRASWWFCKFYNVYTECWTIFKEATEIKGQKSEGGSTQPTDDSLLKYTCIPYVHSSMFVYRQQNTALS